MENLGLIFYKTCYDRLRASDWSGNGAGLIQSQKRIVEARFDEKRDLSPSELEGMPGYHAFRLQTIYPGLTAGLGYAHGVGKIEGDSKQGFSFEYVTGQPYLPGSTVKGVLRGCFAFPELVRDAFGIPELDVKALESAIFDRRGDVFFDGVVACAGRAGTVMGEDYVTPHTSPIKDPVPIKFLKVLPGVVFEFRFLLTDAEWNGMVITADRKAEAFQKLLEAMGIGAKTNVGYGALVQPEERRETPTGKRAGGEPIQGQIYEATAVEIRKAFLLIRVEGLQNCSVYIGEIADGYVKSISDHVSEGERIRVKYLGKNEKGWHCFSMKGVK